MSNMDAVRRYRERHPERVRDSQRRYRERNREKVRTRTREGMRAWYKANPGKPAERARERYRADPETYREKRSAWVAKNRESVNRKQRERWAVRSEEYREKNRRWQREHPEHMRALRAKRRAKKAEAGGSYTAAEWRALVQEHDGSCGYCGVKPRVLHADHRTPIARGGSSYIANIMPACPPCNARKGRRTEAEFRAAMSLARRAVPA